MMILENIVPKPNDINMTEEQEEKFLKFIFEDDLDFYEEFTIHLTDEQQEKFFKENPDFMSEFPVSRDKIYLLKDEMFELPETVEAVLATPIKYWRI